MKHLMTRAKGIVLALAASATLAQPAVANDSAQDEELAYSIGLQAYIGKFPMMDLYRTLWETSFDPDRGHDRTLNEFFFFDRLITSDDDWVITPNEDTIYQRAFIDLRAEPVILVIPDMGDRKFWFPIGDMHHDINANLSWDTVGSRGGAFALVPPGWHGVLPEGVIRVDVDTPLVWILGRFAVNGPDDVAAAAALQPLTDLVPLSLWGQPDTARPDVDAADFPRLTRDELTDAQAYFTTLNTLLRLTPRDGHPTDIALTGWLRELGLDAQSQFDWDSLSPESQRGLTRAATEGHRIIADRMPRVVPTANNWQIVRLDRRISDDPMVAAGAAMLGLLWNPKEISTYDLTFFDGTGEVLDGSNQYRLHFDVPPPVAAFWSLTMYSAANRLFVPNALNRYSIGDRTPGLVTNDDGSVTLYIQAEEPTDPVERANWLPAPEGLFYLVTRHYSPRPEIITGDWLPPPVERR